MYLTITFKESSVVMRRPGMLRRVGNCSSFLAPLGDLMIRIWGACSDCPD